MGKWINALGLLSKEDVKSYTPIPEIQEIYEQGIYQKPFSHPGGYEGKDGEGSLRRHIKYLACYVLEKRTTDFTQLDFWWLKIQKSKLGFSGLLNNLERLAVKKYKMSKISASQFQKDISVQIDRN